jgi:hypothetical protein
MVGVGRTRSLEYGKPLPVPEDFLIPTCAKCGETYMDPDRAEILDALLAYPSAVAFDQNTGGYTRFICFITPDNIDAKAAEAGVTREPGEEWADWAVRIGERLAERRGQK